MSIKYLLCFRHCDALTTLSHLFLKVLFYFKGTNHSHFNIKTESQGDYVSFKAMVDQWNWSGSKEVWKRDGDVHGRCRRKIRVGDAEDGLLGDDR